MAATGAGFAAVTQLLAAADHRGRRHAQSVERRRQRVPADGARRARARRRRSPPHRGVRALRARRHPRRRASARSPPARPRCWRARRAGRRAPACTPCSSCTPCSASRSRSPTAGCRVSSSSAAARRAPLTPLSTRGPHAGGAVQPRLLRRRLRRAVAVRAVALPALRPLARRRRHALLRDRAPERAVVSRRGARGAAASGSSTRWCSRTCPPTCASSRFRSCRRPRPRDRAPVRAQPPVADGRADAKLVRDGDRHAGGASRGGEHHRGPAQPRLGGEPVPRGLPACRCRRSAGRWWPQAALKIVYDLLLLAMFRHVRPPEEK